MMFSDMKLITVFICFTVIWHYISAGRCDFYLFYSRIYNINIVIHCQIVINIKKYIYIFIGTHK